jgi:hypothetical protein
MSAWGDGLIGGLIGGMKQMYANIDDQQKEDMAERKAKRDQAIREGEMRLTHMLTVGPENVNKGKAQVEQEMQQAAQEKANDEWGRRTGITFENQLKADGIKDDRADMRELARLKAEMTAKNLSATEAARLKMIELNSKTEQENYKRTQDAGKLGRERLSDGFKAIEDAFPYPSSKEAAASGALSTGDTKGMPAEQPGAIDNQRTWAYRLWQTNAGNENLTYADAIAMAKRLGLGSKDSSEMRTIDTAKGKVNVFKNGGGVHLDTAQYFSPDQVAQMESAKSSAFMAGRQDAGRKAASIPQPSPINTGGGGQLPPPPDFLGGSYGVTFDNTVRKPAPTQAPRPMSYNKLGQ